MRKFKVIFYNFLFIFILMPFINVCAEHVSSVNEVTQVIYGANFPSLDSYTGDHIWLPGYDAIVKTSDNTEIKSSTFCLDPDKDYPKTHNKKNPDNIEQITYEDVRNNSYKKGLYNMYRKFYNMVRTGSERDIQWYRAYFELGARAWKAKIDGDDVNGGINRADKCARGIVSNSKCEDEVMTEERYNLTKSIYDSAFNNYGFNSPYISNVNTQKLDENIIKYSFDFNLGDFDNPYSGIKLDSIGYSFISDSNLEFVQFKVIDGSGNDISNCVDNYSASSIIDNTNKTFEIIIDHEKCNSEKVFIQVEYKWNHPLNPHNIYILENGNYQDMFLITDFIEYHKDLFELNSNSEEVSIVPGNSLEYEDNESEVNRSEKDYEPDFGVCKNENYINGVRTDYINTYCKLDCTEGVKLSNLFTELSVKAGTLFSVSNPRVDASKSCTFSIETSDWSQKFNTLLEKQIYYYKEMQKYNAAMEASANSSLISCYDSDGTYTYERYYSGSYEYYDSNLNRITDNISWGGCNNMDAPEIYDNAEELFIKTIGDIEEIIEEISSCNNYLNNKIINDDFFDFNATLEFYYQQTYVKNNMLLTKWNNERENNIDDSLLSVINDNDISDLDNEPLADINYEIEYSELVNYEYIDAYGDVESESLRVNSLQNIERDYSATYALTLNKYVEGYTGIISGVSNKYNYSLDPVYNIFLTAQEKTDNTSYYAFKDLYYYENSSEEDIKEYINSKYSSEELKRYCDYEITNDNVVIDCDEETEECDILLNYSFKVIDSNDLDPTGRMETDNGFKNWKTLKGQTVMKQIEEDDTYNLNNLEYSFTLDSAAIKKIRNYNNGCDFDGNNCYNPITYSNNKESYSELVCNEKGNECISKFITELSKSNGYFGNSIATNIDGRYNWKYLDYNSEDGYFINTFARNSVNYDSLYNKLNNGLGSEVINP